MSIRSIRCENELNAAMIMRDKKRVEFERNISNVHSARVYLLRGDWGTTDVGMTVQSN